MRTLRLTSTHGGPWYEYYREVCPICGHKGGCMIHEDGNRVVCIRVASDIDFAKNSACPGWLHFLKKPQKIHMSNVERVKQNPKRKEEELDRFYRALLNELTLAPNHRSHLMIKRQLSEEQISVRGYRSFPEKPWTVLKRVIERLGEENLAGIPGVYVREGKFGPYYTLNGYDGILIPFRNHKNQIVGMQYRVDKVKNDVSLKVYKKGFMARVIEQPDKVQIIFEGEILFEGKLPFGEWKEVSHHGKKIGAVKLSKGQRYFWLSSANKEGGTGAGNPTPCHIAVPYQQLKQWERGKSLTTHTAWLIEGPLKADICADKVVELFDPLELDDIGTTFISIPGANSWRVAIPYIQEMGIKKVNIALDADAASNRYVKQHLFALAKWLKEYQYKANIVIWNEKDGKGLDDLFLNQKVPLVEPLIN